MTIKLTTTSLPYVVAGLWLVYFWFCLKTGSHYIALLDLELTMQTRLALMFSEISLTLSPGWLKAVTYILSYMKRRHMTEGFLEAGASVAQASLELASSGADIDLGSLSSCFIAPTCWKCRCVPHLA